MLSPIRFQRNGQRRDGNFLAPNEGWSHGLSKACIRLKPMSHGTDTVTGFFIRLTNIENTDWTRAPLTRPKYEDEYILLDRARGKLTQGGVDVLIDEKRCSRDQSEYCILVSWLGALSNAIDSIQIHVL